MFPIVSHLFISLSEKEEEKKLDNVSILCKIQKGFFICLIFSNTCLKEKILQKDYTLNLIISFKKIKKYFSNFAK